MCNSEMLKEIFERVGICLNEDELDKPLEIDSIQFVSLIIFIEETFMIRLSADYEDFSKLRSFNDFLNLINRYFEKADI